MIEMIFRDKFSFISPRCSRDMWFARTTNTTNLSERLCEFVLRRIMSGSECKTKIAEATERCHFFFFFFFLIL